MDYKKVVQVFRNSTSSWICTDIEVDGKTETIKSTAEHPFFVLNATADTPIVKFEGCEDKEAKSIGCWVAAKDLEVGNKCLLSNGKTGIISKLEVEHLAEPETTYNFEVANFHTYYVGEQGTLVHNACPVGLELPDEGIANSSALRKDVNGKIYSAKTYGADGRVTARIDFQGTPHYAAEVGAKIIPHAHSPITWVNGIPKDPKYAITLATYIGGLL